MQQYPIILDLKGKRVIVIGNGSLAEEKIKELKVAEAEIIKIASEKYQDADLEGAWLVIAATEDSELNAQINQDATARHIWVNAADDPANCSAILPARVRRGSLLLTISTGGLSPALSSWFRRKLETEVGPEFEELLNIVSEIRSQHQKTNGSTELLDWQTSLDLAVEGGIIDSIKKGNLEEAKVILEKCLS